MSDPTDTANFVIRWYHYLEATVAAIAVFIAMRVWGHQSDIVALRAELKSVRDKTDVIGDDVREIRAHLLGEKK